MKKVSIKQLGVILAMLLGIIMAFSPVKNGNRAKLDAKSISSDIINRNDHVTPEQLGELIIAKDPDVLILDIRDSEEYNNFHIESAYNMPLETLFQKDNLDLLDRNKLIVLYSNGETHAAQAWVLLREEGFSNLAVLLGGLNYWVDVYKNPKKPSGVYADSELFNYQFQLSAGNRLMGNVDASASQSQAPEPAKISIPKPKKRKKPGNEGC